MRARRVDANHVQIAKCFEKLGCLVHRTIGDWDLTISRKRIVRLIEVKDPNKPPSSTRLTKRAQRLVGDGWPISRVETIEDCLTIVREME